ncbi:MAG: hypothetical protein MH213_03450 [Marinobacter sp.]|nr:hypothetical protein [Marinobacter sp.]
MTSSSWPKWVSKQLDMQPLELDEALKAIGELKRTLDCQGRGHRTVRPAPRGMA